MGEIMKKTLVLIIAIIAIVSIIATGCDAHRPELNIADSYWSEYDTDEIIGDCVTDEVIDEPKADEVISEPVVKVETVATKPSKTHKDEHGKIFSFQFKGSTATSSIKPWCKSGTCGYLGYSIFRGTPADTSYLDVIKEYCNSDEIVGGEYYTMTATVLYGTYLSHKPRIVCKVQNEDIIVSFSVEFRKEFAEAVDWNVLKDGDEVTFRGRYYDVGCGWEDCELITK